MHTHTPLCRMACPRRMKRWSLQPQPLLDTLPVRPSLSLTPLHSSFEPCPWRWSDRSPFLFHLSVGVFRELPGKSDMGNAPFEVLMSHATFISETLQALERGLPRLLLSGDTEEYLCAGIQSRTLQMLSRGFAELNPSHKCFV